jgi:hypothetical protein
MCRTKLFDRHVSNLFEYASPSELALIDRLQTELWGILICGVLSFLVLSGRHRKPHLKIAVMAIAVFLSPSCFYDLHGLDGNMQCLSVAGSKARKRERKSFDPRYNSAARNNKTRRDPRKCADHPDIKVGELASQARPSFNTYSQLAIRPRSTKSNKREAGYPGAQVRRLSVRSLRVQCMHTSHWINFL